MDSTLVLDAVSSGAGAIERLAPLLISVLIIPLVQVLKNLRFFTKVEPASLTGLLAIGLVALLNWIFVAGLDSVGVISTALSLVGAATLLYRGPKMVKSLKQKVGRRTI